MALLNFAFLDPQRTSLCQRRQLQNILKYDFVSRRSHGEGAADGLGQGLKSSRAPRWPRKRRGAERGRLRLPRPVPPSGALGGISSAHFLLNQHHHLPAGPAQPWAAQRGTGSCRGERGEGRREDPPPRLRNRSAFCKKKIVLLVFITTHCLSDRRHPRLLPRGRSGAVEG